ncbi:hypothetical protein LZ31DRAFT_231209 [Colletotrichum somersetense]|nr:hypothetical protein LZ31DRAFT_231209 [Colletotrichum somersetense]
MAGTAKLRHSFGQPKEFGFLWQRASAHILRINSRPPVEVTEDCPSRSSQATTRPTLQPLLEATTTRCKRKYEIPTVWVQRALLLPETVVPGGRCEDVLSRVHLCWKCDGGGSEVKLDPRLHYMQAHCTARRGRGRRSRPRSGPACILTLPNLGTLR